MAFDFTNCANTEQQVSLNNNALVCMPLDNRHVYGSVLKLVDCWRVFKNVLLGKNNDYVKATFGLFKINVYMIHAWYK